MIPERKYASGIALRTALEERLKRVTREEGVSKGRGQRSSRAVRPTSLWTSVIISRPFLSSR